MIEQIHFITYADQKFINARKRLCKEALESNWFRTVKGYGPDDLEKDFKYNFYDLLTGKKDDNFLPKKKRDRSGKYWLRGGGYWVWKLNIIQQKLKDLSTNDILIYCDAGCHINVNGRNRFREYIDMLDSSDECIISFQLPHIEKAYTTKQIFDYFKIDINSDIANSGQYMASVLIMKKNDKLLNILREFEKLLEYNPLLISDHYNKSNKNKFKYFKDNRHDQSVFSILRKIFGSIVLTIETYGDFESDRMKQYPFWAVRKRD